MNCPYCKVQTIIKGSRYTVRGDDSPDTETELFLVQELMCRNPQCEHDGEVVQTIEHKIDL